MRLTPNPDRDRTLTRAEEDLLRTQEITTDSPGTILRDFDTFLDYLGKDGVPVSATQHYMSGQTVTNLNARLSRPLVVNFKRPGQKSFPYVHALYHLVRASGLAYVEQRGKQNRLLLDPGVVTSWDRLNPVEQYFNLFEAWMKRLDRDGFRDLRRFSMSSSLHDVFDFVLDLPQEGITFTSPRDQEDLRYHPGFLPLAWLDLFGLLEIDEATTEQDTGWQLRRLAPRPFGRALMKRVVGIYESTLDARTFLAGTGNLWKAGKLQKGLRPFFPEWKKNLFEPIPSYREGIFVFKVSLHPEIWRRIAAPSKVDLDELADTILTAFDFWEKEHLYDFRFQNPFGQVETINHPVIEDGPWTDEIRVGDVPVRPGQHMTFIFDFGDRWQFDLHLEAIEPKKKEMHHPEIIESHGEAPEQYPDYEDEYEDDEDSSEYSPFDTEDE